MNIRNKRWLPVFTLLIFGANKQTLKLLFLATVTSISLNIVPAFAATPGTWVSEAGFGTFDLIVNAEGTEIERINLSFSNWTCGPVTYVSGGFGIISSWPITNDSFSATVDMHTEYWIQRMTIEGTFDSATQASGIWQATSDGVVCGEGTWQVPIDDPETSTINPGLSGAWYNEDQDGHGLNVIVLDENRTIIYWYVYHTDGTPMFLIIDGTNDGNSTTGTAYYSAGMRFGEFNPNDHELTVWGMSTVTFHDCNNLTFEYSLDDPAYGSGSIPMTKLASVSDLPCSDSQ